MAEWKRRWQVARGTARARRRAPGRGRARHGTQGPGDPDGCRRPRRQPTSRSRPGPFLRRVSRAASCCWRRKSGRCAASCCGLERPSTRSGASGRGWSTRSPISPSTTRSPGSPAHAASTTGWPWRSPTRSAASNGWRSPSSDRRPRRHRGQPRPHHRDDLLRSVALALEGTLRQSDTLARLGQDDAFTSCCRDQA